MSSRMPKTPFSTPLSGSAKEAEARIRNIFQGQKKRPALIVMVLALLLIALCGSLVSFRPQTGELEIAMQMQYYDQMGNYIEIPVLQSSTGQLSPDAQAVNAELTALAQEYRDYLSQVPGDTLEYRRCLLFPSTTDRYLNLVLSLGGSLDTASVRSWVYDLQEGQLVTLEEALALAGLTQEELLTSIPQQRETYIITGREAAGFRIRPDGQPEFYLRVEYRFNSSENLYSNLYLWSQGECTEYSSYSGDDPFLIPDGETDELSPPLWYQWHFAGEEPEGGFTPLYTSMDEEALTHLLFLAGNQWRDQKEGGSGNLPPFGSAQLLLSQTGEGVVLGAASFNGGAHVAGLGNLVVGLFDAQTLELVAGPFGRGGDDPQLSVWTGSDGATYLLGGSTYTISAWSNYSGLMLLRFDGRTLEEVTQLPAQASYAGQPLPDGWEELVLSTDDEDFWYDYLAVPFPGGADLFLRSPDYNNMGPSDAPQWLYQGRLTLDPQAAQSVAAPALPEADGTVTQMVLDYYNSVNGRTGDAYLPQDLPAQPQEGDRLVQSIVPVVSYPSYETVSGFYLVRSSLYYEDSKEYGQGDGWFYIEWTYALVDFAPDMTPLRARSCQDNYTWDGGLWSVAQNEWPDVWDPDAALWREGYPAPVGFGSTLATLDGLLQTSQPTPEDPQEFRGEGPGVAVTYYQHDPDSIPYVHTVDTTRSDLYTRRGIRVGSSRAQVRAAYSGLHTEPYAPEYEGQDCLWYSNPSGSDGSAHAVLFFFEEDTVSRILVT